MVVLFREGYSFLSFVSKLGAEIGPYFTIVAKMWELYIAHYIATWLQKQAPPLLTEGLKVENITLQQRSFSSSQLH